MAYTRLPSPDDGDHGDFDIEKAISNPSTTKKSLDTSHIRIDFELKHSFLASWRLLIINLVLLAACLGWLVSENRGGVCSPKMVSTYSPMFDRVGIYDNVKASANTFWPSNPPSIFQQRPNAEVDAAWRNLTVPGFISISALEVERLHRDPSELKRWPDSEDEYIARPAVFHQLQCLDLMRKAASPRSHGEPRYGYAVPAEQDLLRCQYVLVRALMCHADLEIVTFNKVEGITGPFADFSNRRRCRNFGKIRDWYATNVKDLVLEDPFGTAGGAEQEGQRLF